MLVWEGTNITDVDAGVGWKQKNFFSPPKFNYQKKGGIKKVRNTRINFLTKKKEEEKIMIKNLRNFYNFLFVDFYSKLFSASFFE